MSKIFLDEAMRLTLVGVTDTVEICHPDGSTAGFFVPSDEFTRAVYDWAKAEVTDEELDRVRKETGGSSLADIKKRLGW